MMLIYGPVDAGPKTIHWKVALSSRLDAIDDLLQRYGEAVDLFPDDQDALKSRVATQALRIGTLETTVRLFMERFAVATNQVRDMRGELTKRSAHIEELRSAVSRLEAKYERFRSENDRVLRERDEAEEAASGNRRLVRECQTQLRAQDRVLHDAYSRIGEMETRFQEQHDDLHGALADLENEADRRAQLEKQRLMEEANRAVEVATHERNRNEVHERQSMRAPKLPRQAQPHATEKPLPQTTPSWPTSPTVHPMDYARSAGCAPGVQQPSPSPSPEGSPRRFEAHDNNTDAARDRSNYTATYAGRGAGNQSRSYIPNETGATPGVSTTCSQIPICSSPHEETVVVGNPAATPLIYTPLGGPRVGPAAYTPERPHRSKVEAERRRRGLREVLHSVSSSSGTSSPEPIDILPPGPS